MGSKKENRRSSGRGKAQFTTRYREEAREQRSNDSTGTWSPTGPGIRLGNVYRRQERERSLYTCFLVSCGNYVPR